jgi:twitching motility protein PilT
MARIDLYLRSMERFGATGVVLQSEQNVKLRFPTGDRHATQTVPHRALVELIHEIAGREARVSIGAGRAADFDYESEGKRYRVAVTPVGTDWTVEVSPAPAAAPEPESIPIERTSYEPVTDPVPVQDLPIERTRYDDPGPGLAAASAPPPRPAPTPSIAAPPSDRQIDRMLVQMKELGASDLHLTTGSPPYLRLHGEIEALDGYGVLGDEQLLKELMAIAPDDNRQEFADKNDTDFAYAIPNVSRFRVNVFRDRLGPGAVFRAIPFDMPSAKQLGVPEGVLDLCNLTKGLVLVTGPTGSGKSTTLASLIDHINETRRAHIITIEDPIEFIHPNKGCLVNQREVRTHTTSFKAALRAALREDPDIVLVGEMRDLETIAIAVETAETGHLVFGTLHTTTAPSTVDRIIDQFPPDRQEQIRTMLAESLKGVISQTLLRKTGGGRVAAYEILLGNSAVANLIREGKTFQLFSIMQTARNQGMITLNDSLIDLVRRKLVEPLEAYRKSVNKSEFKNMLSREGINL